ncbi:hypothetical protein NXX60_18495 [Bacteroides thetaiotaomicron]|nr:hypothetical protein NXX60_18495 [Bacteroides thetaiotaomicron]
MEQNGFDVSARQYYVEYEKQLEHFIKKETFAERMESYCMNKDSGNPFEARYCFFREKISRALNYSMMNWVVNA